MEWFHDSRRSIVALFWQQHQHHLYQQQPHDNGNILTDYEGELPNNQGKDGVDERDEDRREETTLEDRGEDEERPG